MGNRTNDPMIIKARMEMLISLAKSVDQAGGAQDAFSPERLRIITALELIEQLAPNRIRFTYIGKEVKSDHNRDGNDNNQPVAEPKL